MHGKKIILILVLNISRGFVCTLSNWVLVLSWIAINPIFTWHGISLAKVHDINGRYYKIDNMALRNQDNPKFRTLD